MVTYQICNSQGCAVHSSTCMCVRITAVVTVGFLAPQYNASEMDYYVTVEIRLTGSTEIPLTLYLSTTDQTAVAGEDFVRVTRMAITLGSFGTATQLIQLINDDTVEEEEQFQISLEWDESLLSQVNSDQTVTVINVQDNDCKSIDAIY